MHSRPRIDRLAALVLATLVSACSADRASDSQQAGAGGLGGNASPATGGSAAGTLSDGAARGGGSPANGAGGNAGEFAHAGGSGGAQPSGGAASGGNAGAGAGTGGAVAGTAGEGGASTSAVCNMAKADYAAELEQQLGCDPNAAAQCSDRVAVAPGCACRVFIEPADPFAIEHLSNVASGWFDADCSDPVCPEQCSTAQTGTCQVDANSARGGRCKTP